MKTVAVTSGKFVQCEQPEWRPLCGAVGDRLAGQFMWMAEIELDDGTRVHAYKHVQTRRYLHLDMHGRIFVLVPPSSPD